MSEMKIKKVLCPIDFSDRSGRALEYAAFIAMANDAILILLHVVEYLHHLDSLVIVNSNKKDYQHKIETKAKEKLDLLAHKYSHSIMTETIVRVGKPFLEIVRMAREIDADQIVIGSHGRTGIPHMLLGSVAEKVSRKANCPVLIFREKQDKFEMP